MLSRISRMLGVMAALAVLLPAGVRALEPATPLARLARQSWSMENGLPQNTVPVLMQSRSGYLWAGTELGLARFDGVTFRTFDHATVAAFPDAEVRCLLDASEDGKSGDLWVGTGDGLVRWVHGRPTLLTTHEGLLGNSIEQLAETSDGKIWARTEAGLARWTGSSFEAIAPRAGLHGGEVQSIAAGANGDLWAGSVSGVAVFRQERWEAGPSAPLGLKAGQQQSSSTGSSLVTQVGEDVLIASQGGVWLEHHGALNAVAGPEMLPGDGASFLARLADGTIAVAGKSEVVLVRGGSNTNGAAGSTIRRFAVAKQLPGSRIEAIYADREGCLWVGTNHGMARIGPSGAVESMPIADPLAAEAVVAFLEDREGDLWVGTEAAGLHLLRDARFRTVGTGDGLTSDATTAVVEDRRGGMWIGTRDAGLNHILNGHTSNMTTANGLLSNVILALAAAPGGDLWVGTPDGLNRISATGVIGFTSADGLPDDFIRSVLVAPDASIWVGTRHGLTHLNNFDKLEKFDKLAKLDKGHFENFTHADGLGSDLVGALARTADGDLWIATLDGLSRMHQGRLQNYTIADGLSSNVITALQTRPNGMIWVGTQNDGLNLWDGQRFLPVRGGAGEGTGVLPSAIHAILEDGRGYLWLASDSGLVRAEVKSLLDCALRKACALRATHFTTADGLRSRETSSNSHPTACRRADGELWFTTPRGVVVTDPAHFAPMPDAPPVAIERFAVNDQDAAQNANGDVAGTERMRVPAGALRFQFDYAGLSFAAPQKLRYQYMLEGFDHGWTDAGTRRTAYYTNIPPGPYRFRVRAAFGDSWASQSASDTAASYVPSGVSEASLSFELRPHLYQTLWFYALCLLLLATAILWFLRRRVLHVEREFRAVSGERNRIAREIHDTLAQGYVGISLQLEVMGELLRHKRADAAAQHLAVTQQLVREGLDDARQSIWALRSQDAGEQTLPIRLRRLVEQAQSVKTNAGLNSGLNSGLNAGLSANLEVHGAYRALAPEVEKEVLRIAQEAIQNVKLHAHASRLSVRLDYEERALVLSIADDGKGFQASASAATGHYGLTGMRERASLIHAELAIVSEAGEGTTVRLSVPAPTVPIRDRSDEMDDATKQVSGKIEE